MISNLIEIKFISPTKGKGLFAKEFIEKGTINDIAYAILIPARDYYLIENTYLGNYLFDWDDPEDPSDYKTAIPFTFCEFLNHSYTPNCGYQKIYKERSIVFYAIRNIQAGEELTINYNRIPDDKTPVWFNVI